MTWKEELPGRTGILKEESKSAYRFGNTVTASGVYSASSTDLNTSINGRVQASSVESSLQWLGQVAQDVVTLLWPRRIEITTGPKPKQLSEDVRVSTRPTSINIIALSDQILNSIPQTIKALEKDIAITINMSQQTTNCSKQKEVDSTSSVRAWSGPFGSTKTPKGDDVTCRVSSEVSSISTLNDQ